MNFLPEKKYGVPSHNFVKKNVLCEKGDEITRFDGSPLFTVKSDPLSNSVNSLKSSSLPGVQLYAGSPVLYQKSTYSPLIIVELALSVIQSSS